MRRARRGRPDPRRRRHHPGHAAGLLLRQDRADHRRRQAPDGDGDERPRLRRRRAGQPRVQLRLDTLRTFERQLDFPLLGANAVDRRPGSRSSRRTSSSGSVPATAGHGRHPRPGQPRAWPSGKAQRRGQAAVPRHRRAGEGLGAADEGRRRRRRHRLVPLRRDTVLSYGDALPYPENAERAGRRAGARHRRDPGRPRAPRDPRAVRHEHRHRPAGAAQRAAQLGHAGQRDGPRTGQGARAVDRPSAHRHAARTPTPSTEDPEVAGRAAEHEKVSPTSTASSAPPPGDVGGTALLEDTAAIDFVNSCRPAR